MKPKLILCLVIVLSGGLFGCSSVNHHSANSTQPHWDSENPLTARQLAEVKKNFHQIHSGMTEDEVFSMLDLAGYQHRLLPDYGISHPYMKSYQLAENERLMLFFDNTGMKTVKAQFPNGEKLNSRIMQAMVHIAL